MLIYDLEIVKAIPDRQKENMPGVQYCRGWEDHRNMGISVIGVYEYMENKYRVFCKDNWDMLKEMFKRQKPLVGFNNIAFDNKVLRENGFTIDDDACYDILQEIWIGDNLEPVFKYPSHTGYGLDAVCKENFNETKSGNGALAPVQWQKGEIGRVIDYCLNDVKLTKNLVEYIIRYGEIKSPKEQGKIIEVKKPGRESAGEEIEERKL